MSAGFALLKSKRPLCTRELQDSNCEKRMNMEPVGAFPEGEWDFSRMFSMEELDFTPEFPGQRSFTLEHNEGLHFATPSAFCTNPGADVSMAGFNESSLYSWSTLDPNLLYTLQENSSSSNCSSVLASPSSHENYSFGNTNYFPETNDTSMCMDICIMDERIERSFAPLFPEIAMTGINEGMSSETMGNLDGTQLAASAVAATELELKRKFNSPVLEANRLDNMKKKPRVTRHVQSNKENAQPRRNKKLPAVSTNDEEQNNPGPDGQSSSSFNSDEDNASQDSSGAATSESKGPEALNSNAKTRAGRGSATDPQSLYARKRRERINERLRILQNLVPNGTKVDISTMLEEAVHYVKFLQLQIKLLSSDDKWMYAPIAYNGMDVGLNQKISTLLL